MTKFSNVIHHIVKNDVRGWYVVCGECGSDYADNEWDSCLLEDVTCELCLELTEKRFERLEKSARKKLYTVGKKLYEVTERDETMEEIDVTEREKPPCYSFNGIKTHVDVFREIDDETGWSCWLAEHRGLDIMTQGDTKEEALEALREMMRITVDGLIENMVVCRALDRHGPISAYVDKE